MAMQPSMSQLPPFHLPVKPMLRRLGVVGFVLLTACDDLLFGAPHADAEGSGWCAVEQILASECTACHTGSSASGQLDLSVDPHAAIVGVDSALYAGQVLITPGDPDASLLYTCLLYTSPSPRDLSTSRMPSSA